MTPFHDYCAQHGLVKDVTALRSWAKTWEAVYETGPLIELHYSNQWNESLPLATQPEPNKP
jgi:hypothetical protein